MLYPIELEAHERVSTLSKVPLLRQGEFFKKAFYFKPPWLAGGKQGGGGGENGRRLETGNWELRSSKVLKC